MKMLLILLPFLLESNIIFSQNASLSNDRMNVVYVGIENPISVAISGYSEAQIKVEASAGILTGKNGKYVFKIASIPEKPLRFTVYATGNKKQKVYHQFTYRVKYVPDPILKHPCGHKSINACIDNIIEYGLKAEIDNFDFDVNISVISFDFSIIKRDSTVLSYQNQGSQLQNENKIIFRALLPGEKVEITNVKISGPDDIYPFTQKIVLVR